MRTLASPSVTVRGVVRRLDGEPVLRGVDLEVRPGTVHALVGLNGAGKTTLMRVLLGMVRSDAGEVIYRRASDAIRVAEMTTEDWRDVGHLVEVPFFYPELTATETVIAAARLRGLGVAAAREAAHTVIERLAIDGKGSRKAGALSLGNRQRLGLACALVHDPRMLLLDEPANALDPAGVRLLRRFLRETADAGTAVLVSSHHLDEMARIADTITVLHRGRVVGTLPPDGVDLERQFFEMVADADGLDGDGLAFDGLENGK